MNSMLVVLLVALCIAQAQCRALRPRGPFGTTTIGGTNIPEEVSTIITFGTTRGPPSVPFTVPFETTITSGPVKRSFIDADEDDSTATEPAKRSFFSSEEDDSATTEIVKHSFFSSEEDDSTTTETAKRSFFDDEEDDDSLLDL